MRQLFNIEGPVFVFLSKMADLIILNLLFLICSIPVITLGASLSALSYVLLKMKEGEEGYVARTFLRSMKENLKQGTAIWLILLVPGLLLFEDYRLISYFEGSIQMVMRVGVAAGGLIWLTEFVYVFALQARFYNSVRNTCKNALLLGIANLPRTVLMLAVVIGSAFLTLLNTSTFVYGMLVWVLIGFALVGMINTEILYGAIKKLMPPQENEPEKQENQ